MFAVDADLLAIAAEHAKRATIKASTRRPAHASMMSISAMSGKKASKHIMVS
jgi:hypothetical protein